MVVVERLCLSVICATCCVPAPAFAMERFNPAAPARQGDQSGSIATSSTNRGGGELDPIIVTARRMKEELQETPISVVALSANELEARSVTNLRSLQNFVPNLTFAPSQNVGDSAGNIFIRGIGQEDFLAGTEPGVGLYLDGIYVARSMGTLLNLVDVDRIEVLRGPQGTLYGKNAIGGSINIISTSPATAIEGGAGLIAGNLGRVEARGMINVPLTDKLFARLAAGRFSRDGYLKRLRPPFASTAIIETNYHDGGRDDSAAGRLQLRWLASPSLTMDFAADASRRRGTQSATHIDAIDPRFGILPAVNSLIRAGELPGPEITDFLAPKDWLRSHAGGPNSIAQDIAGLSATATKNIGLHSIRFVAAHRRLHNKVTTDLDGTWFAILQNDFAEHHHQNSAELQASGKHGRIAYAAGLYALGEWIRTSSGRSTRPDVLYMCGCFYPAEGRPTLSYTQRRQSGHSYAAYAQASIRMNRQLSATLGGRFSHERKETRVELVQLDPDTLMPTEFVLNSGSNEDRWAAFTWRTGLEFRVNSNLMLYASAAKGYKSGGFNTRPVSNLPNLGLTPFGPETALTYETGIRSTWLGRRLRLNATIFHTDYRDIQLRQQAFVNGILTTLVENAARARIRGVEIEADARLGDALSASLSYGHVDPRYLDVGRVPNLTLDTPFQRTPRHSFTASLDYSFALGANNVTLHGDYSFRSREQFQLLPSRFDQPGYGLLGARLILRDPATRWSAAIFGSNVTDKRHRVAGRGTALQEVGIANSIIGLPRQVGVEIKTAF